MNILVKILIIKLWNVDCDLIVSDKNNYNKCIIDF